MELVFSFRFRRIFGYATRDLLDTLDFELSRQYLNFVPTTHLHRHGSHDGPLVPLERLQRHLRDLLVRLAQELLARRQQHLLVLTLDLDLRRHIGAFISHTHFIGFWVYKARVKEWSLGCVNPAS